MKNRLIAYILILSLFLSVFPFQAAATGEPEEEIVLAGEGWYITVTITETETRALQQKNGTKEYKYTKTSDGSVAWIITLTGTFTYNGTMGACIDASRKITIYDSSWYEVSSSSSWSGNTATCTATMGHKLLGVTTHKETHTLTLSCDKNGNLS